MTNFKEATKIVGIIVSIMFAIAGLAFLSLYLGVVYGVIGIIVAFAIIFFIIWLLIGLRML